ncbi:MAG: SoxR reducing system RseC family protein [Prolixibacteraceae bacterium]|nr:SoxR reducing system RseC family protein [Prolixibacteraceae bacterium]MBN2772993.1 SoxR reducing system RseC family protein [Prolixibacteraceae bacterium]
MSEVIRHKAFVKLVTPDSLIVTFINESACAACHAKGACSVSDFQEKEIEITGFNKSYSPGDEVNILFKNSNGFKALFFGYLLPFLILLATLITLTSLTEKEGVSGLISLGILIPYYITLYFFRDHLKKIFKFEIEEIN